MKRRDLLYYLATAAAAGILLPALSGCSPKAQAEAQPETSSPEPAGRRVIRLGYQKGGATNLMRLRGTLEPVFKEFGVRVEYVGFPAGPQLLEAMGVGSVDIGSTGESPAIFAQAAGAQIVYIANQPPGGDGSGQAIIVPQGSPIKTIADLKGKRIAFQKASGAHNFVIQILDRAKVNYKDFQPVYLSPPDARPAFDAGKVDAWAIWDPFLSIAQAQTGARTLVDGTGIFSPGGFYLASRKFATEHPDWVRIALEEIDRTSQWAWDNPKASAQILAKSLGISADVLERMQRRSGSGPRLEPIDEKVIAAQQQVADNFHRIGLLPKKVDVRNGVLSPKEYGAFLPAPAKSGSVRKASR